MTTRFFEGLLEKKYNGGEIKKEKVVFPLSHVDMFIWDECLCDYTDDDKLEFVECLEIKDDKLIIETGDTHDFSRLTLYLKDENEEKHKLLNDYLISLKTEVKSIVDMYA